MRPAGLLLTAACLAGMACGRAAPGAEFALTDGRVFTADPARPWAEAVLVRGDRIAALGTTAEVLAAAGPGAVRVDLGGRLVVPGFNDAHDHIAPPPAGATVAVTTGPDPLPDPPFALVRDSLRAAAARTPAGTWLRATVGERVLSDPGARRVALDRIAPDHPVELAAWTGHGMVLNGAALAALGVADTARDPLGGRYERDAAGRLTGRVDEYAGYGLWRPRAEGGDSALVAAFRARGAAAAGLGITSIQNMVTGMEPEALARVLGALDLPYRLHLIPLPLTAPGGRVLAGWDALRAAGARGAVRVSGTKWILDGTPVERLAALRAPYSDRPGWHGRLNFPPDTVRVLLAEAVARGHQPVLHAVGDSAIGLALALMAEVAPDSVWRRLRPRLEHGDGLAPDQYEAARRLGVVVVQNPSHFALGAPLMRARYGAERLPALQPMRSLLAAGIPVALGSDGPLSPFVNLMFAVLHPDTPAEALTMEEAVRAYTAGSAFAEHAEADKGRLAPGLLADLAVLSQDIFAVPPAALPGTASVLTMVGGRVVHDPGGIARGR